MKKQFGLAAVALSAALAITFTACGGDSSSSSDEPTKVSKVEDLSEDCEDGEQALVGDEEEVYTCAEGKWEAEEVAKSSTSKKKSSSSKTVESSADEDCDEDIDDCDEEGDEEDETPSSSSKKKPSASDDDEGGSGSGGSGSGESGSTDDGSSASESTDDGSSSSVEANTWLVSRNRLYIAGDSTKTTVELTGNSGCSYVLTDVSDNDIEENTVVSVRDSKGNLIAKTVDNTYNTGNDCRITLENLKTSTTYGYTTVYVSIIAALNVDETAANKMGSQTVFVYGAEYGRPSLLSFLDAYVKWNSRTSKTTTNAATTYFSGPLSGKTQAELVSLAKTKGFTCTEDGNGGYTVPCKKTSGKATYNINYDAENNTVTAAYTVPKVGM